MAGSCKSSNILGWCTIESQFDFSSQTQFSKRGKKIKKRTRILNGELKKFASLKSYSQYVKIKTNILRNVSDNEFTEDEASYVLSSVESEKSTSEESYKTIDANLFKSKPEKKINISYKNYTKGENSRKLCETIDTNLSKRDLEKKIKISQKNHIKGKISRKPYEKVDPNLSQEEIKISQKNNAKGENSRAKNTEQKLRVKRNLTYALDNFETKDGTDELRINEIDYDNAGPSRCTPSQKLLEEVTNAPAGDSGIDDDSQDNSSTNNPDNEEVIQETTGQKEQKELPVVDEVGIEITTSEDEEQEKQDSRNKILVSVDIEENREDARNEISPSNDEEDKREDEDKNETLTSEDEKEKGKNEEKKEISVREDEQEKRAEAMNEISMSEEEEETMHVQYKKEISMSGNEEEKICNEDKNEISMSEDEDEKRKNEDKYEVSMSKDKEEKRENEDKEEKSENKDRNEISMSEDEENREEGDKNEISMSNDEDEGRKNEVKNEISTSTNKEKKRENGINEEEKQTAISILEDEGIKKKSQPTITSTEIVKSKYTIIRNLIADEFPKYSTPYDKIPSQIEESMNFHEISPESQKISRLKRIDLFNSDLDSDSSITDNEFDHRVNLIPSQTIDNLSDSEEFSDSSSFRISDCEDFDLSNRRNDVSFKNRRSMGSGNKSIKHQIEEQEIFDSTLIDDKTNSNNKPKRKKLEPTDKDSLRYVFKELTKTKINDEESYIDDTPGQNSSRLERDNEENLSRPIELQDFISRQELVPSSELSTLTMKDISASCKESDSDEEIWLMEIPRSIVTDGQLCGKSMVIEEKNIRIGDISYNTSLRPEKSVSCILQTRKKKARYKAVNIRPVYSIIVRQKSAKEGSLVTMELQRSPKSVPFPKSLKSRNSLIMTNEARASSSKDIHRNTDGEKKKRRKTTKRKKGPWHIDRFILKSKKSKINNP